MTRKPQPLEVWHPSGEPRTHAMAVWVLEKDGMFGLNIHGLPFMARTRKHALNHAQKGEVARKATMNIEVLL